MHQVVAEIRELQLQLESLGDWIAECCEGKKWTVESVVTVVECFSGTHTAWSTSNVDVMEWLHASIDFIACIISAATNSLH